MNATTAQRAMYCQQYKTEDTINKAPYEMGDGAVRENMIALFIKSLFVTIRSLPCRHRFKPDMVRSLTCDDLSLNMSALVPSCPYLEKDVRPLRFR